jgi:endonuclease YncB( thermonuclease family)
MRRRAVFHLLCLVLIGVPARADWLMGRVVAITDGDTLTILTTDRVQHRVRLAGIDTPEKRQPFGQVAKDHLSRLVNGQTVTVHYHKRDRYGRIVGKVLASGADVGLRQVEAGLAWHYKQYQGEQDAPDRARYANVEIEAREAQRGLWALPETQRMPPWEWRHGGKKSAQAAPVEHTAGACGSKRYCREMVTPRRLRITCRRAGLPDWMTTAMVFRARRRCADERADTQCLQGDA